jgi:glyoxylase-like metal-dependent hydrolase (beta-lactamase superfamily II)
MALNCKVTGVPRLIDVCHLGRDRVIGAYEVDGVIVDPGPTTSLAALDGIEPRALLLTHIHLDHAGSAGVLARRHPELVIYVHERGARHLADPSLLLKSAGRLYGNRMEELWGEVAPVPEEQIRPLSGGETVEGFRVEYTPGHAAHHVCYLHEATGDAYVGDVAGVRIPPGDYTIAPTPPPDIDVEAWARSIDTVAEWRAERLCLTHFGYADDPDAQLGRTLEALARQLEWAQLGDPESFHAALSAARPDDVDPQLVQAAPPEQLYLGLERYLKKRAEAAA